MRRPCGFARAGPSSGAMVDELALKALGVQRTHIEEHVAAWIDRTGNADPREVEQVHELKRDADHYTFVSSVRMRPHADRLLIATEALEELSGRHRCAGSLDYAIRAECVGCRAEEYLARMRALPPFPDEERPR